MKKKGKKKRERKKREKKDKTPVKSQVGVLHGSAHCRTAQSSCVLLCLGHIFEPGWVARIRKIRRKKKKKKKGEQGLCVWGGEKKKKKKKKKSDHLEKQKIQANKARFREASYQHKSPSKHAIRKLKLIRLVYNYTNSETIQAIMEEVPNSCASILNLQYLTSIMEFNDATGITNTTTTTAPA